MNCHVYATDVHSNNNAKGVSIAMLFGKTTKRTFASLGHVIAPRVTQVQQILNVDIVFVKHIAFILGMFTARSVWDSFVIYVTVPKQK